MTCPHCGNTKPPRARIAPKITNEERRRIAAMFEAGTSLNNIHRITGRSAETLRKIREGV